MRKKKIIGLGLAIMLGVSLVGCQGTNKSNGNSGATQKKQESSEKTEKKENSKTIKVDTSWYENDGSAISSGIFVVGESLKAGNYTFTANDIYDGGNATVAVFEDLDKYKSYYNIMKFLSSGENIDEDAVSNELASDSVYYKYLNSGEACGLNVADGNVIIILNTKGTITNDSNSNNNKIIQADGKTIESGMYSADQLGEGVFMITYLGSNESSEIVLFPNQDEYNEYKSLNEFLDDNQHNNALGDNALIDCILPPSKSSTIVIDEESILLVNAGPCYIQKVKMNWSADGTK